MLESPFEFTDSIKTENNAIQKLMIVTDRRDNLNKDEAVPLSATSAASAVYLKWYETREILS